jgi:hypothetical protein
MSRNLQIRVICRFINSRDILVVSTLRSKRSYFLGSMRIRSRVRHAIYPSPSKFFWTTVSTIQSKRGKTRLQECVIPSYFLWQRSTRKYEWSTREYERTIRGVKSLDSSCTFFVLRSYSHVLQNKMLEVDEVSLFLHWPKARGIGSDAIR